MLLLEDESYKTHLEQLSLTMKWFLSLLSCQEEQKDPEVRLGSTEAFWQRPPASVMMGYRGNSWKSFLPLALFHFASFDITVWKNALILNNNEGWQYLNYFRTHILSLCHQHHCLKGDFYLLLCDEFKTRDLLSAYLDRGNPKIHWISVRSRAHWKEWEISWWAWWAFSSRSICPILRVMPVIICVPLFTDHNLCLLLLSQEEPCSNLKDIPGKRVALL